MRRIFLNRDLADEVTVRGDDARHLGYALRSKPGDAVAVTDSAGRSAVMEMAAFTADSVALRLVRPLDDGVGPATPLALAVCLMKGEKFERVVQKATELGVDSVQPLTSERCVVRYDERKGRERVQRWNRVAAAAAQQCGRRDVPEVCGIMSLSAWLPTVAVNERVALCYEGEGCDASLRNWLRQHAGAKRLTLVVGCEGGFGESEIADARFNNVVIASLGPRILRAETAALVAVTLAQYELGELD